MNQNNPSSYKNQVTEDEIDLGKLFDKIGNFFLNTLLIFFRNIKLFLTMVVLGIALSLLFYFRQSPVFISEMTISSRFLTTDFCSLLISNLNNLVEEQNYNQLQHQLKIDKKYVEDINKIDFAYLKEEDEDAEVKTPDSVLLLSPFKVRVEVSNNQVLDVLGPSIENYFANNKYAKRRENIEKENIKNEIDMLVFERKSLDSLKKLVAKNLAPRESKAGFVYGEPYEPLNIYNQELTFFERELKLRKKLVESESVEVIQNFTKYKKPKRPISILKCLAAGIFIGALIGVIIMMIKELFRALKSYEKRKITSIDII